VIDQAGAVVSGATVTAHNLETHAVRTTVNRRSRQIFDTFPGPWARMKCASRSMAFRKQSAAEFILPLDKRPSWRMTLRLGQVNEQVKVTADAPLVSLTYADISGTRGGAASKGPPAKWQEL